MFKPNVAGGGGLGHDHVLIITPPLALQLLYNTSLCHVNKYFERIKLS